MGILQIQWKLSAIDRICEMQLETTEINLNSSIGTQNQKSSYNAVLWRKILKGFTIQLWMLKWF